jgi:3-deoxy-D-manno-octulosonic-acid transferase
VDRIGILFELYGLGDLIFCGGTMEPIGGHNILEPAAWEKPVFYGPHLQKVINEHNILQSFGGSFVANNSDELRRQWSRWIRDLPALEQHGRMAREALGKLGGSAVKQVELILNTIPAGKQSVPLDAATLEFK